MSEHEKSEGGRGAGRETTSARVPRLEYLAWARAHFEHARYDLATSGMPTIGPEALGVEASALVDSSAPARFRAAVAARYGRPEDEVALVPGAAGAVYAACRALIEPGDTVAVEAPGYEPLVRVPEGLGARVVRFARRAETGYALEPDAVLAALGPRGKLAIVTDLHNPTGCSVDRGALRELAHALAARGGYVLVDEVYRDFLAPRDGVVTARDLGPNVVAVSSLTKVYGVSWARAGWVLAPPSVRADVDETVTHVAGYFGFAGPAAGVATLARADALIARARELTEPRLARVDEWVRARSDVAWVRPPAGLFGFVRITAGFTARALIDGPCARRGVLVGDGAFFDAPDAFRLGLAAPGERFEQGLALLGEALDELRAG